MDGNGEEEKEERKWIGNWEGKIREMKDRKQRERMRRGRKRNT